MDNNPSILSHVSIGTNQFERAVAFYDKVLLTLGCRRMMGTSGCCCLWQALTQNFGYKAINGQPASSAMGRISVLSPQQRSVHAFHQAALAAGGLNDGAPGSRPDYGEPY